jgi:hypothetical protein
MPSEPEARARPARSVRRPAGRHDESPHFHPSGRGLHHERAWSPWPPRWRQSRRGDLNTDDNSPECRRHGVNIGVLSMFDDPEVEVLRTT